MDSRTIRFLSDRRSAIRPRNVLTITLLIAVSVMKMPSRSGVICASVAPNKDVYGTANDEATPERNIAREMPGYPGRRMRARKVLKTAFIEMWRAGGPVRCYRGDSPSGRFLACFFMCEVQQTLKHVG